MVGMDNEATGIASVGHSKWFVHCQEHGLLPRRIQRSKFDWQWFDVQLIQRLCVSFHQKKKNCSMLADLPLVK